MTLVRSLGLSIVTSIFGLGLLSCSPKVDKNEGSAVSESVSEEAYCSSPVTVSDGVTVTGTATYFYRATDTSVGLTGVPVESTISYAEIVVKNSSGTTIQCSSTGAQGQISFVIPKTAGDYTVLVNSRSATSKLEASVLKDISSNMYYTLQGSFSLSGSESTKDIGKITAYARVEEDSELKGGAFHILKAIYKSNEFIRNSLADPSWVSPKVSIYWKVGFNPNSYRSESLASSGLSYYGTGSRKLYILGGIQGNIKNSVDTDHFDDSVIIHEYGHFLEDVYAKQDSPGGSHNGNAVIDARLAWGEGWANFFQAAVLTNWNLSTDQYQANANFARGKYYIDTLGFSDDSGESGESGSINIIFNLSVDGSGSAANGQDMVSLNGEGTFREMSISRTLFKAIASSSGYSYGGDIPFSALWKAFSSATNGLAATNSVFRNIGLFNKFLDGIIAADYSSLATKWNSILSNEKQNKTMIDYANPLSASSSSCTTGSKTILPTGDNGICSSSLGTSSTSHKLRSNDFYSFYHDGGSNRINMNYSAASGFSIADLDLVVYKYDHVYFEECDESLGYQFSDYGGAGRSVRQYGTTENGSETVNFANLPAGYYLVVVKANTLNKSGLSSKGSTYSMEIEDDGTTRNLCPLY